MCSSTGRAPCEAQDDAREQQAVRKVNEALHGQLQAGRGRCEQLRRCVISPKTAALSLHQVDRDVHTLTHSTGAQTPTPPADRHSPTPLSVLNADSASAHRTPYPRRWQCESRSDVAACLAKMVNSAWAGGVRWVCSRAGWTGTPPHPPPHQVQAACRFVKIEFCGASCLSYQPITPRPPQ